MSHSNLNTRMATSISLALAAAITACGGGSNEAQSVTADSAPVTATSAADAASSASADLSVTTNTSAVNDVTQAGVTSTSTFISTPSTSASTSTPAVAAAADTSASIATTVVADASGSGNVVTPQAALAGGGKIGTAPPAASPSPVVSRPAGNTGTGFFVSGGKLYDASGNEFRIRGVNRNHWDSSGTPTGLPLSGANTERVVLSFSNSTSYNWGIVSTQMLANKIVPIPGSWLGTCKADVASLNAIVDTWVAQASTWTQLNSNGLINIANEWGPANSTVWRDSYIAAVSRMREAGYTGTLVVDTGGCGQDVQDVVKYGAAVLAADPQKNILFDIHIYGTFHYPATASWMQDYDTAIAQLKSTGLALILGEFGPGKNVGPSPTMITPQQVIATAEAAGWGWMPWSWDDNNLPACKADDAGFSMTTSCGSYRSAADLTAFGKIIVPVLQSTAVKATIFN